MAATRTGFRLTAWLAATSLAVAAVVPAGSSRAQDATGSAAADPPALVGRLSLLSGDVSSHGPDATQWTPAVLNFPFTSGDALWTQPQAQADIEIGSSVLTLAPQTELDLATLDERSLVATEPQGDVFLDLRQLPPAETFTINTPHGAVQIATDGEYEILAGDADTPTQVAVVRGAAQLTSGSLALRVHAGQMAIARGTQDVEGDVEPLTSYDAFLTRMLARSSVPVAEPPAVQGMTGAEDLGQYGAWQDNPDYGEVWFPQVSSDWAPYRDGSWAYVEPWGWTWVDSAPWGFAPFHYGRWAQTDQRWCWVPGEAGEPVESAPVYAPALVDFVVAGAVAGVAGGALLASLRSGRGDVGWVPLGPHERYRPPYGGGGRYVRRLNPGNGWRELRWGGADGHHGFANRHGMTIAPVSAMARSQPIGRVARGIASPAGQDFRNAALLRPMHGALPIRPTGETRGVTTRAAQRLGIAGGPSRPQAPGPAINPALAHRGALPAGRVPFRGGPVRVTRPIVTAPGPSPVHGVGPHPAGPAMPALRAHQQVVGRPGIGPRRPVPGRAFATPRPTPPAATMAPLPRVIRPEPPRPIAPRLAPRPFAAPRPMPLRAPMAPPMARPIMPRPMEPPHFAPARPRAAPPAGRPPP